MEKEIEELKKAINNTTFVKWINANPITFKLILVALGLTGLILMNFETT